MDSEEQSKISKEIPGNSFHVNSDPLSLQQLFPASLLKVDLDALWKRPAFYSEGSGVKLKHIPAVAANIEVAPQNFVEMMHLLLYLHTDEKPNIHRNILEFCGLKCGIGTVNYMCRMKIISVFSLEQLVLICRVLCLPLWDYSKQILVDAIINFLMVPQMLDLKGKVAPISSEEFINFDLSKIHEIMLHEAKTTVMEQSEVLPSIHIPGETTNLSAKETSSSENKSNQIKRMESKQTETEEREMLPDIRVSHQTSVLTSFSQHLIGEGNTYFSKALDVPHVLQSCQNYDFRYQRELLKSGVTLNMNPDDYLEQAIGEDDAAFRIACVKYLKNYRPDHHQPLPRIQHCRETEEQAATRRAQNAQRMRNYRQSLRELETEQQAAERRAQNALRMRNYRKFKRELEPDLAAERRAQNAERMRNYRKVKRELEPEKAARRRAQNALRMRNYRKNKRQQESE